MFRYIISICLVFFVLACQRVYIPQSAQTKIYMQLISLDSFVSHRQAKRLAKELVYISNHLKQKFHPVIEPHFNNLLVNLGIQKGGLCYEWSDSLYLYFKTKEDYYTDFKFHLLVSHQGEYWSEHNAFAISLKGHDIEDGLVVDLWRDIDGIYVSKIKEDKSYHWVYRKDREIFR